MKHRVLICSGGTGGHMFPANVLAIKLLQLGYDVEVLSDRRGLKYLTKTMRISAVNLSALGNRRLMTLPLALLQFLLLSLVTAYALLRFKPDIVVGFGGYVTYPLLFLSRLLNISYVLHEQNAVMGRVNRKFAPDAKCVMTSFPQTLHASGPVYYTGLPIREEFLAIREKRYQLPTDQFHILIIGGSQGARIFSQIVPQALAQLPAKILPTLKITQQCREEDISEVRAVYQKLGVSYKLDTFITHIADEISNAHLTLTRAGASSLSEITVAGRPALYIPYPQAMDDHQSYNAKEVVDAGGGWMVAQKQFSPEFLSQFLLDKITDKNQLSAAADAAYQFGNASSLQTMVEHIETVLKCANAKDFVVDSH